MSEWEVQVGSHRRTPRVQIAMQVVVRGADFRETTSTVTVSAHGCLVMLGAKVARDELIRVTNPRTTEDLPGVVVYLGKPETGKVPVGIEFREPSASFWKISFPPEDWKTSAERKGRA